MLMGPAVPSAPGPHTPTATREGGRAVEGLTHSTPTLALAPLFPVSTSPISSRHPRLSFWWVSKNPSLLCGSVLDSHCAHFPFRGRALLHDSPASEIQAGHSL